jgi:hypothetical protein
MRTCLRMTIQLAWAFVGVMCGYLILALLWSVVLKKIFSGGLFQESIIWNISHTCALILGLFLLSALVYEAWIAVFRFSSRTVSPTVFVASVVLFCVAAQGENHITHPLFGHHKSMLEIFVAPFLELFVAVSVLVGPFIYYRVVKAILTKLLLPELHDSAARIR